MSYIRFVGRPKRCEVFNGKAKDTHHINSVGIRFDNKAFRTGQSVPASYDWIDSVRQKKKLPGTSAIGIGDGLEQRDDGTILVDSPNHANLLTPSDIKRIAQRYRYPWSHAYVIAGDDYGYGEDDKEVIIRDARVIYQLW